MIPTTPPIPASSPSSRPPRRAARSLGELTVAMEAVYRQPVVCLREALLQLQMVDEEVLETLAAEDPELLRSRSDELVDRLLLTEDELHRALARVAGLAEVDVLAFELDPHVFDRLSLSQAQGYRVVPLGLANGQLFVASCVPTNEEQYHQLCSLSGHSVRLVWASGESIDRCLEVQGRIERSGHAHSADAIVEEVRRHFLPLPPDQAGAQERLDWEDLVMQAMVEVGDSLAEAGHAVLASESPAVVRLVNQLIGDAFAQRVSEIQIESKSDAALTAVRFRHQGELQPQLWLPAKLREPLVSRIKRMAGLDVAERRRLQEGRIDFAEFGGQALTLRVVAPPARAGVEELALRLLTLSRPAALVRLGLRARDRVALAGLSQRRHGLVLVVGPRGSGRTTTLHAVLAEVDSVERKVWSAEDPVEFQQLGVRQVQLNPRIGLDAVRAVNGFVQAGADVIALGELRDADTAHAIVAAAVNGPLALSTLPTDTACETVVHLLEQGVDAARLAGAMQGIVAQRLVRALCRHCASPRVLAPDEWDALLQEYMEGSNLSRPQAQVRLLAAAALPTPDQVKVRHAVGCEHCGGKGYRGRTGVFEILQNSPSIRQLIQHRAQPDALRDAAVAEGMRSLRQDALEKVVQGRIDLKQARSVYR